MTWPQFICYVVWCESLSWIRSQFGQIWWFSCEATTSECPTGRNPTNLIKSHRSNYVNPIGSIYSDKPINKRFGWIWNFSCEATTSECPTDRNPTNLIKSHRSNYVNPIGSIYSDKPIKKNEFFSTINNLQEKLDDYVQALKSEGMGFLQRYLHEVRDANLTEAEDLQLSKVAIRMIETDNRVEYNEVAFFKKIRQRLKSSDIFFTTGCTREYDNWRERRLFSPRYHRCWRPNTLVWFFCRYKDECLNSCLITIDYLLEQHCWLYKHQST